MILNDLIIHVPITMRLKLFTSLASLLFCFSAFAQNDTLSMAETLVENTKSAEVGIDFWGFIAVPIAARNRSGDQLQGRFSVYMSVPLYGKTFFDVNIGVERRNASKIGDLVRDYRGKGAFIQPGIGAYLNSGDNLYLGGGIILGRQKERLAVVIPGDYFKDRVEYLDQTTQQLGVFVRLGFSENLSKSFRVKMEAQPTFGRLSSGNPIMPVYTTSGGGINWGEAEHSNFALPIRCFITYIF